MHASNVEVLLLIRGEGKRGPRRLMHFYEPLKRKGEVCTTLPGKAGGREREREREGEEKHIYDY